jgi:starch phosphorylase
MLGAQVIAKAYDNPIPGYQTKTVGNLRLWQALAPTEFDLQLFNEGKYDEVRHHVPLTDFLFYRNSFVW